MRTTAPARQGRTAGHARVRRRAEHVEACIDDCQRCDEACMRALAYATDQGTKEFAHHVRILLDCAEICRTHAGFMLRGSEFEARLAEACADVCDACAEACEGFRGDAEMEACAEACRRAAEGCRAMAPAEG